MYNSKLLVLPLLAASFIPMQAAAQSQPQETIEVRATSPMIDWQHKTTEALERGLARAASQYGSDLNESVVQVAFQIGADGKAKSAKVLPGDGNNAARRTALNAIKRLDTLDEIPVAAPVGRNVLANIIFYRSAAARDRLEDELAASEQQRLSSADGIRFIAIGASPTAMGSK